MNRDPPRLAVQSPYILLRRSSKPNSIYLHEKWCLSPFKIITTFLEALGMSSENLINRLDRQIYEDDAVKNIIKFIDPRPEFQLVYERMPINLVKALLEPKHKKVPSEKDIVEWGKVDLIVNAPPFHQKALKNRGSVLIGYKNLYLNFQKHILKFKMVHKTLLFALLEEIKIEETVSELIAYCYLAMKTDIDDLRSTGLTFRTLKMLNNMYCITTELCGDNKRKVAPAPEGIHISLHIYSSPPFYYNCSRDFVCRDYLEVRTASDLSLDGFRIDNFKPSIESPQSISQDWLLNSNCYDNPLLKEQLE
uniref:Uncharacterized protein n=1 Tax=Romanomermis culicivorax TaxID=13658 RepID=A0A915JMB9_ROMCU